LGAFVPGLPVVGTLRGGFVPEEAFSLLLGTFWVPFVSGLLVVGTLRGGFVPEEAFFLLPGHLGCHLCPSFRWWAR